MDRYLTGRQQATGRSWWRSPATLQPASGTSARSFGLTERSVQAIVADLEAAGYLTRARTGRRVVYTVNRETPELTAVTTPVNS